MVDQLVGECSVTKNYLIVGAGVYMRSLLLGLVVIFGSTANALSLSQDELFEFVQVNEAKSKVSVTSDGQGTVLVIDAEFGWGHTPVVTFENNVSECQVESIELNKVNPNSMNYWIKVRATKNTEFDGCTVKIKNYMTEYIVNYSFWTS